jgi:hypothetical protein
MFHRLIAGLVLAAALAGCATYRNSSEVQNGPGVDFKAGEIADFRANQDAVMAELVKMAGLTQAPQGTDWDAVIDAGMDFADSKCEGYMHALFRLDRDKKTVSTQISLMGTAAAGLMAAAESAAKEVAAVAVLFGLANSTIDNLASNLLYDLDPSSVRTMVKALQSSYRSNKPSGYASRAAALRVIRGYATLCVPANIEAEVNLAVKQATPSASDGNARSGEPPEVSNAESAVKARVDDNTALLRDFVFPGGQRNNGNLARLEQFIASKNLRVDVSSFMRLGRFATERAEAVTEFKLK